MNSRYLLLALALTAPLAAYAKPPAAAAKSPVAAEKPPATPAVPATTSMLRVTCEGDDAGAEVTVNGKFKGECPIDMQVAPGTLMLRVEKKDPSYDRIFEQEIRMGDGVVKKVEAILSKRLNAAGQKLEDERLAADIIRKEQQLWQQAEADENAQTVQAYLNLYPNGSHVAAAREKLISITDNAAKKEAERVKDQNIAQRAERARQSDLNQGLSNCQNEKNNPYNSWLEGSHWRAWPGKCEEAVRLLNKDFIKSWQLSDIRINEPELLEGGQGFRVAVIGGQANAIFENYDILIKYAGHPVSNLLELKQRVTELSSSNENVKVVFLRNRKKMTAIIKPGPIGLMSFD